MIFWVGNDNLIRLVDLVDQIGGDEATPAAVLTATVTAQIKNAAGTNVGTAITLAFVTGTNGDYEGVAADTLALVDGADYTVEVTADDGPNRRGFWVVEAKALKRLVR
jgi:hypothetical protein